MNPEKIANSIEGLLTSVNYEVYTPNDVDILIALTDYIRPIPKDESHIIYNETPYVNEYRITPHTESHDIFSRLKEGYANRNLREAAVKLLEEYNHFEILIQLTC